jgi:hypothetical protein
MVRNPLLSGPEISVMMAGRSCQSFENVRFDRLYVDFHKSHPG